MKNKKIYRPGGMPAYGKGGKTYSTKGYKDAQKKGGLLKKLTNHQFGIDLDFIGDATGAALGYLATQQQQAALQDMYDNIATPEATINQFTPQLQEVLTPDPSATIQNRISEVEGRNIDVEIDTSALGDKRDSSEQSLANVLSKLNVGGTKGFAGLGQVLAQQNKSDLGISDQALNIETQETTLEEAG
jgi:hypothetical protein